MKRIALILSLSVFLGVSCVQAVNDYLFVGLAYGESCVFDVNAVSVTLGGIDWRTGSEATATYTGTGNIYVSQYFWNNYYVVSVSVPPGLGYSVSADSYGRPVVTLTCVTAKTGTATFHGCISVPNHSKAHKIGLKYKGVLVGEQSSVENNGSAQTVCFDLTVHDAKDGDSYEWVIDGVGKGQQTVSLVNLGSVEHPIWSFSSDYAVALSGGDYVQPTPPPPSTPTPTPYPTASPGSTPVIVNVPPQGGGGPGGGGGTVAAQGVVVENPNDFYDPVKRAVADAGQGTSLSGPEHSGFEPFQFDDRGHLDEVQDGLDSASDSASSIQDDVQDQITTAKNVANTLPTVYGQDWSDWDFGTYSGYQLKLPISQFGSEISLLRQVLVWLLALIFLVLSIRALTYQN